jgi:hypothetical protein
MGQDKHDLPLENESEILHIFTGNFAVFVENDKVRLNEYTSQRLNDNWCKITNLEKIKSQVNLRKGPA